MSQELTFQQVAGHNTKKDLYLVIHDKVYDVSKFVDEHPGGEEVLLDVGGQDATEAFEDVGHSDEARETLSGMLVGDLKRMHDSSAQSAGASQSSGLGFGLYAVLLLGGAAAYVAYQYLQNAAAEGQ